jgi:hypothetical protein
MRPPSIKTVAIGILAVLVSVPPIVHASGEYYTAEEIDYLRDAQGIAPRVTAILKLANIRLVTLGMKEKSKDDIELEKRISEIHDDLTGKPPAKPAKPDKGKPPAPDIAKPYLNEYTPVEILRGYIEAIAEIRDDIDDAYREKHEVRGPLEQFEKFCVAAVPLLRRFQAHSDAELQAIDDARSATEQAVDDTEDALKIVPKTEKSTTP